jgi:hypothetical protein
MPHQIPITPRRQVRKPPPPPNPRDFFPLVSKDENVLGTKMSEATRQGCEIATAPVFRLDTKDYVVWISKPSTK